MDCYQHLGLEPIINACGTVTRLGGAPMAQEILVDWQQAAQATVPLEQLQAAACRRISEYTQTEAGLVTSGAAAALTLGAAAILAGHDVARMEQLPRCDGFPHEFLIASDQRNGYDHAVRAAGARLVPVGMNELMSGAGVRRVEVSDYEAAITPQTAGILYVRSADSRPLLTDVVQMAQRHQLPVLVDAAAELPPRSNLYEIPGTGADLVAFSGGKAIGGPQGSGILCGRRQLVSSAALQMLDMDDHPRLWDPPEELIDRSQLQGMPRHGMGRGLKVSKEDIVALLFALDLFVSGEAQEEVALRREWLVSIADELEAAPVQCHIVDPDCEERWPVLEIHLDRQRCSRDAFEICRELRNGQPSIYVGHSRLDEDILLINPSCMTPAQVVLVTAGLQSFLTDSNQRTNVTS